VLATYVSGNYSFFNETKEIKMNTKQLAEFYGISTQAVNRWDSVKRHRKTIQAEADVTPLEWQLVGEIAQLCYLYNAQNWFCEKPTNWACLEVSAWGMSIMFLTFGKPSIDCKLTAKTSNTAEMQLIKMQLEKLVY
jgi:hypothetical protein